MKCRLLLFSAVFILPLCLLLGGCATPAYHKAAFVTSDFNPASMESITVMPVVDLRINKEKNLDCDSIVHPIVEQQLKERKYKCVLLKDRKLISDIDQDSLESHHYNWLSTTNVNGRWIFLPVLYDSYSKLTFGSTGNAEVGGYIFDKDSSKLVWQEKGTGSVGQGGLIGMAMKGLMEESAIQAATAKVMTALPVK